MKVVVRISCMVFLALACSQEKGDAPQRNSGRGNTGKPGGEIAGVDSSKLGYNEGAKEILDKACVSCHGLTPASGAPSYLDLSTWADRASIRGVKSMMPRIKRSIEEGTMPPKGQAALSTENVNFLKEWFKAGAVEKVGGPLTRSLVIVTPGQKGANADGQFNLKVDSFGFGSTATWLPFFVETENATTGGTEIGAEIDVSQSQQSLDTKSLTAGNHYFYVTVKEKGFADVSVSSFGPLVVGKVEAKGPAFVSLFPKTTEEKVTGRYRFEAQFTGVDTNVDSWDLFLASAKGTSTGGQALFKGRNVGLNAFEWDEATTQAPGTYYFYAVLHSGGKDFTFVAPGSIVISHPAQAKFDIAKGDSADAQATFNLSFTGADSSATWSLYWTTTPGATSNGTLIEKDISVTKSAYTWNTQALTPGLYFLYAEVTNVGTKEISPSSYGISVSHPMAGNIAPTVSLTAPAGGDVLMAGSNSSVTFTSNDGNSDALTFTLEWSADGGVNWTALASSISASPYQWMIPSGQAKSNTYLLRISADDGKGGKAFSITEGKFEIK